MGIATIIGLAGPFIVQGVKLGLGKLSSNPKLGAALPFAHLGIQMGGAALATKFGVNPFEGLDLGGVDPSIALGVQNTAVGAVAYGAWSGFRKG
jgi:hypothetical protein